MCIAILSIPLHQTRPPPVGVTTELAAHNSDMWCFETSTRRLETLRITLRLKLLRVPDQAGGITQESTGSCMYEVPVVTLSRCFGTKYLGLDSVKYAPLSFRLECYHI